mmetsp:Transcript_14922/g.28019  ORF Transcript_14922/g.28019 Transcript_14922/m.28019 type:complete len:107 (-) Transcript_14922:1061-1381(-)
MGRADCPVQSAASGRSYGCYKGHAISASLDLMNGKLANLQKLIRRIFFGEAVDAREDLIQSSSGQKLGSMGQQQEYSEDYEPGETFFLQERHDVLQDMNWEPLAKH